MALSGDTYFDVALCPDKTVPIYDTFNLDGTYSGRSNISSISGTYTTEGNTITTYSNGSAYYQYEVISLSKTDCVLKMYTGSTSYVKIKCTKE